jgi:hypothetical protein
MLSPCSFTPADGAISVFLHNVAHIPDPLVRLQALEGFAATLLSAEYSVEPLYDHTGVNAEHKGRAQLTKQDLCKVVTKTAHL